MYHKLSTNLFYSFLQIILIAIIIYVTSFYSYNLFHALTELMIVIIGFGIYMIAWNSKNFINNKYFLFLGVAFFAISLFELLHALAYKGMGLFSCATESNMATQLWLIARYLESFTFLAATFFIGKQVKISKVIIFYITISVIFFVTVFWWPIFPTAYIESHGLTKFKAISELIVSAMYLTAAFRLYQKKSSFNPQIFKLLITALIISVVSEILFMSYVGVYDQLNLIGHLLKIFVFGIFYIVFIETGLRKPYSILFKELKDSETKHRESEERFRTMFDNASVSVLITELSGEVTEANKRFCTKTSYTENELQNISAENKLALFGNIFESPEFIDIRKGEKDYLELENLYTRKNGQTFWGLTTLSLFKADRGAASHILWIIKDITAIKEVHNTKLEFVSLASHQLRTPLTSIRLASELLLRGVTGPLEEKQNRYLQEIHESTKTMTEMIKDLLNVSRVELGTLTAKLEPTDLIKISDQISDELELHIKAKKLHLSKNYTPDLPIINFDHQIYRMIFENLLTNAIFYTPEYGSIIIGLVQDGDYITLSISDTGFGIPDFDKNQIFDKLFRTDAGKEINPSGTGLGLYIVKSVAEKAGAKVWFDSKENVGTTFYVSIPINQKTA